MGALWGGWGWTDMRDFKCQSFIRVSILHCCLTKIVWCDDKKGRRGNLWGENGNWKSNSFPLLQGWQWSNQFWWESCEFLSLFLPCCAVGIKIAGLVTGRIAPQFPSSIRLSISNVFTCLFRGGKTQKMTSLGILSAYLSLSFLIRPRVWQQTSSVQGHFWRY